MNTRTDIPEGHDHGSGKASLTEVVETKRQLGRDLNTAKPINLFYVPTSQAAKALCAEITTQVITYGQFRATQDGRRIRQRTPKELERLQSAVTVVISACLITRMHNGLQWLSCSLRRGDYNNPNRYQNRHLRYRSFHEVIYVLASSELGFIEGHIGYRKANGEGRSSRIRATDRLLLWAQDKGICDSDVYSHFSRLPCEEVIILKAPKTRGHYLDARKGARIEYEDTDATVALRNDVIAISGYLSKADIKVDISVHGNPSSSPLVITGLANSLSQPIRLKRIFNNGTFEDGGRLYHGWWQQLKKEQRRHILINGELTVELDYDQMHPTILYGRNGAPLPAGDLYSIDGLDRKIAKTMFNVMLNHNKRLTSWPHDIERPEGWQLSEIQEAIKDKHKVIEEHFYSGIGLKLQRIDSDIMVQLLLYLQARGIVGLPIHDSIIVQRKHQQAAKVAMERIFFKLVGMKCSVSVSGASGVPLAA